jgi:hypothetical protein
VRARVDRRLLEHDCLHDPREDHLRFESGPPAHDPEVAGSNPAPLLRRPRKRDLFDVMPRFGRARMEHSLRGLKYVRGAKTIGLSAEEAAAFMARLAASEATRRDGDRFRLGTDAGPEHRRLAQRVRSARVSAASQASSVCSDSSSSRQTSGDSMASSRLQTASQSCP